MKSYFRTCLLMLLCLSFYTNADECILNASDTLTLYFGVEVDLPNPEHPHTIPTAHTDISIPLRFGTGWDVHICTDLPTEETRVETKNALFALENDRQYVFSGSVPAVYQFIGVGAGETFWYYDQSAAPSPGVSSHDMTVAEINELCLWDPNDPGHGATSPEAWLQMNLVEVRGPLGAHLSMWHEEASNPKVFFSTYDGGITKDDVFYIQAGMHSHNSWAFTKPGLYEVDIQVSAYHLCDKSLTADINKDCVVNLEDFAGIAGQWLICGSAFRPECP